MPEPSPAPPRRPKLVGLALLTGGLLAAGGWLWAGRPGTDSVRAADQPAAPGAAPPPLFASWPQDKKPDLALVLSGQTYGYVSPCGCSRPQKGGLERRANLFAQLRAKGWPVAGLDLGDVAPHAGLPRQNVLKYATTMLALKDMGYVAVGLGEEDFANGLLDLFVSFALTPEGTSPVILAANLFQTERDPAGRPKKLFTRAESFPGRDEKARPIVDALEVVARPGEPAFGVVSVLGLEVADKAVARDPAYDVERKHNEKTGKDEVTNVRVVGEALARMNAHPAKPELRVLLYVGKLEDAKAAAAAFPQFQLILCQTDTGTPPSYPTVVNDGKTQIVQVGEKGQHVGVVGVFRQPGGGFDLKYQMVALTEDYLTPPGAEAEKNHAVLRILEGYTAKVRDEDLLAQYAARQTPHPVQVQPWNQKKNVHYVGSQACQQCHPAEFAKWSSSPHAHAYDTLATKATRPSNRQYDGECLVCHTTGMDYQTGFTDVKRTPLLLNNGCENCHGPGSAHCAAPDDKTYYRDLSRWKVDDSGKFTDVKLPDAAVMAEVAKFDPMKQPAEREKAEAKVPAAQRAAMNVMAGACRKCHNADNDPKFDEYVYWPKVTHSNLKGKVAAGGK